MIDFRPILDQVVFPIFATVGSTYAVYLIHKSLQLLHVNLTQAQAQTLDDAIRHGIELAIGQAKDCADKYGQVTTKSAVIANVANYVTPKVPATIAKLGITPEGLNQRIEARLYGQKGGLVSTLNSGEF